MFKRGRDRNIKTFICGQETQSSSLFFVLECNLIQTMCGRGRTEFILVELLTKINWLRVCPTCLCNSRQNVVHIISHHISVSLCEADVFPPCRNHNRGYLFDTGRRKASNQKTMSAWTDHLPCLCCSTLPIPLLLHSAALQAFYPCFSSPFPPIHLLIYQPALWLMYYCNVNTGKHPSTGRPASGDWARK